YASSTTSYFVAMTVSFITLINLAARRSYYGAITVPGGRAVRSRGPALRQPLAAIYGVQYDETHAALCRGPVGRDRDRIWSHRGRHLGCDHRRRAGRRHELEGDLRFGANRAQVITTCRLCLLGEPRSVPGLFFARSTLSPSVRLASAAPGSPSR